MSSYGLVVEGLGNLKVFEDLGENAIRAISRAINASARTTKAEAARRMTQQINFPRRWLSGQDGKLSISKFATSGSPEAVIRGRDRPTSLARFVTSGARVGKQGLTVAVQPGSSVQLKRAFLVRLRAGQSTTETNYNLGLAIRTKNPMRKSTRAKKLGKDLWLLYGPSVDQVFMRRDGSGVAKDVSEYALDKMETEFLRQMRL
jgi:hypothetical protein